MEHVDLYIMSFETTEQFSNSVVGNCVRVSNFQL